MNPLISHLVFWPVIFVCAAIGAKIACVILRFGDRLIEVYRIRRGEKREAELRAAGFIPDPHRPGEYMHDLVLRAKPPEPARRIYREGRQPPKPKDMR